MKKLLYTLGISALLLSDVSAKAADDDNNVKYCLVKFYGHVDRYYFVDLTLKEDEVEGIFQKKQNKGLLVYNTLDQLGLESLSEFGADVFDLFGEFNKTTNFHESVLFTEKELEDYIKKFLEKKEDQWNPPHNDQIHEKNEYIKSLNKSLNEDEKIIISKSNKAVIEQTMKDYVPGVENKRGGDDGDTSQIVNNPNQAGPIKTDQKNDDGNTSQQKIDQLVDPNKNQPIEINTSEQDKDKLRDPNEKSTFLANRTSIYLWGMGITIICGFCMFARNSGKKKRRRIKKVSAPNV